MLLENPDFRKPLPPTPRAPRGSSNTTRQPRRPRHAGTQPLALGELRAGGIDFRAVAISELELHGYGIERVYDNGRLIGGRRLESTQPIRRP